MTSPTKADREAAANTLGRFGKWGMAELVSEGSEDNHPIVEAIAQARAEGYAQGQRDMRDRAARLVHDFKNKNGGTDDWFDLVDLTMMVRALPLKGQSQ